MGRVLVVDDDPDIAELIALKLGIDGHDVTVESTGTGGLERALQLRPDVLIIDWTLPGMTGPEVCTALREHPAMDATWLMILTARPLSADGAHETAADEMLPKPFSPRVLSQRVSAALARR